MTDGQETGSEARVRGAMAALSGAMLLSSLGTSIANVALPTLAEVFGASFQRVQWVVLAYLLAVTSLIVGVGRLGDVLGRRRVLMAGVGLFTAASAACGVAPTLGVLVAARGAQGLGAAAMMALTLAFVAELVPTHRTGRAMGLLGTMSAVGTALGPSLGGALVAALGWRALFLVLAPLGVAALALAHRHLPADARDGGDPRAGLDPLGTALLALTLTAYALAMTIGRGRMGVLNLVLLVAAALGAGLFVLAQLRVPAPLLRLGMLRDPVLGAGVAMSGLVSTVVMASLVVGPFYLAGALGLGAALVGLVLSVGPVVAALTAAPAGRVVDRLGARVTTVAGLLGMAGGCVLLAVLPSSLGIPGYAVPLGMVTAGYATFQTANNTAVLADVPRDRRGVVSGLLNLSRNLGLITGASLMGAVFALASGAGDAATASPAAVAHGLRATFAVAAALVAAALALALAVRAPAPRTVTGEVA